MQKSILPVVLLFSILVSACGGGGGGDSSPTQPAAPDFDNDGIANSVDTDDDNDGVLDVDDAFPLDSSETTDTDADGIGNNADEDDDNDGVPDSEDAFPLDPSETTDTDADGIGNNADDDDDNDGVVDTEDAFPLDPSESADTDADGVGDNADAYPMDAVCYKQEDGNGELCYLTYFKQNSANINIYVFENQITFLDRLNNEIIQLNNSSGSFNASIELSLDETVSHLAFSEADQVFYASTEQGNTFKVELDGSHTNLYESGLGIKSVFVLGTFIGLLNDNNYLTVIDKNGRYIDERWLNVNDAGFEWDEFTNTAFFYERNTENRATVISLTLEPETGQVFTQNQVYPSLNQTSSRGFSLPPFESSYIFYAGKLFSKAELFQAERDVIQPQYSSWSESMGLITLNYTAGDTSFTWLNNSLETYFEQLIDGAPIAVTQTNAKAIIVTEQLSSFVITNFLFEDDVDGDSVPNTEDDFPGDLAASVDSDQDGFPDNWNEGKSELDSVSGLTLDLFPQDFDCWLDEHALDGGTCDYSANIPNESPTNSMQGPDNKAFIYIKSSGRVYTYSAETEQFYPSIDMSIEQEFGVKLSPQQVEYQRNHERFYLHFGDNRLFAKDLTQNDSLDAYPFHIFPDGDTIELVSSIGNFSLVKMIGSQGKRALIDVNSIQTDSRSGYYFSSTLAWDESSSRLYHFRDGLSPNDLMYTEIDQVNGLFGDRVESPYHGGFAFYGPIRLLNNGQNIVTGAGDIFDAEDLTWKGSYGAIGDILGLPNSEVLTVNYSNDNAQLIRRDSTNRLLEQVVLPTEQIDFLNLSDATLMVYLSDTGLQLERYVINNDSDDDGVENLEDAFPTDAAASVDTDNDGFPDQWNAGYTQEDSTTGLILDSFPNDSACWLDEHANSEGSCDFSATMPEFTPDETIVDESGVVYLYNQSEAVIYRWSSSLNSFVNPIFVGSNNGFVETTPTKLIYSPRHQRLYLGYDSGVINFIDIQNDLVEQPYYTLPSSLDALVSVGEFILGMSSGTSYIIDDNGALANTGSSVRYSQEYAWDQVNNRIYFFRDGTSPNDLFHAEIDQVTGEISNATESPYHGDYRITAPIIASSDGSKVMLGSGDVYDAESLTWLGNIGEFDQGIALDNEEILLINQFDTYAQVTRKDANNRILEQYSIDTQFIQTASVNDLHILVSIVRNNINIINYEPNNDTDNDGVTNPVDAFPMDPAASLDSDQDGYPDSWNDGYTAQDSTTGLQLDSFPNDSACWLSSHADEAGACNYAATMPSFTPSKTIMDESGVVYLLNPNDSKVYRWSTEQANYTNPFQVGQTIGLNTVAPRHMTYSQAHGRLYFGYDDGSITYIDLEGDISQQNFYKLPLAVGGIASTGNYILAQDASGAWSTHYILDENGALTDSEDWNYYSREYAWNSINERVFFFRDGTSPNDLHYETIDQSSGLIIDSGESPYHGDYRIYGPIVISADGSRVILGSGDVYDAGDLTWIGNVGEFINGVALENGEILLITQSDGVYTLTRKDQSNRILEQTLVDAESVTLVSNGSSHTIVASENDGFVLTPYIPNDDSDDDGVSNLEDAFPSDPAASVDSDDDGYPDSWNDGYTSEDSTTGLSLDVFPNDSACWLESHATSLGTCDYAATMPTFTPEESIIDEQGVIYLLNSQDSKVYRWDAETESFTNPLQSGKSSGLSIESPLHMAYSQAHRRLYFAYSDGSITFIDLEGEPQQQDYYRLPSSVGGLVAAGNYMLAQDSSGAWNTHYIIDQFGALTDSKDWNRYSRQYEWNEVNQRIYFFRDGTSPNDLHYETIDQTNGIITEDGESPYHSSANIRLPIRVINQGQHVILGSGVIYDATDLNLETETGLELKDIAAFEEIFIGLSDEDDTQALKIVRNNDFEVQFSENVANSVLRIFRWGERLVLFGEENGVFTFSFFNTGDQDEDGIPAWWEHAYGLSDEDNSDALLDNDTDGLNNLEEFSLSTDPNNDDTDTDGLLDGEEVYDYQTDALNVDSDFDGLQDGEEVLTFGTLPLDEDTDGDAFSDGDEILLYFTDPLDNTSVPDSITEFSESFEENAISRLFGTTENSDASWEISSFEAQNGSQVARSGDISDGEQSSMTFRGLFSSGTLAFDAKVSAESCCDKLEIWVNDERQFRISSGQWNRYTLDIEQGETLIEWRYYKDGSVSDGEDSAFIDNLIFSQ